MLRRTGALALGPLVLGPLALLTCLLLAPVARAQPAYETGVRGVWLTNVASDVLTSRAKIAEAMGYLASRGFNVVFPVVYNKGLTLYPSDVMAQRIGPQYRQDPAFNGRDPLAEVIVEAHRVGMEVIPWFEFGFSSSYSQNGGHIVAAHPSWKALDASGNLVVKNGFDWLDALNPDVQRYMTDLVLEVATKYDVDGIQGDDRLPAMPVEGGYTAYDRALYAAEHGGAQPPANARDAAFVAWKARKLTAYLGRLYRGVKAVDPNLLVSMSPSPYRFGYEEYLQDVPAWLDSSYVDLVHPQLYRYDVGSYKGLVQQTVGPVPRAEGGYVRLRDRARLSPGILVKAGNQFNGPAYLVEAVRFNRQYGIAGEVFFYYEGLRGQNGFAADSLYKYHYKTPAVLPFRAGLRRPAARVVHETDAGVLAGPWAETCVAQNLCTTDGFGGTSMRAAASGNGATATYTYTSGYAGAFDVYAHTPAFSSNRPNATDAAYAVVRSGADSVVVAVNQRLQTTPSTWRLLTTVEARAGEPVTVTYRADRAGDGRTTYADAVMLTLNRKRSPDVLVPTAGEPEAAPETPDAGLALALWPNPARTSASVRVTLGAAGALSVRLYDVLGREVARVFDGPRPAGAHATPLALGGLAPGVYVVRALSGGRSASATLVVR